MTTPTELFLPQLIEGDTDASNELFGGLGDVGDPLTTRVTDMFYFWAAARHLWLRDRRARLEPVAVTHAGAMTVVEVILELTQEGQRIELPVAVVGEEEGDRLRRVRVYHSLWPLYGAHGLRGPLLPARDDLRPEGIVGVYQDALARGDVDAVLATFEPDAVVREPSGGAYTYRDPEARRRFYGAILAGGGIALEHCSMIDDGKTCALEYIVRRWGGHDLPAQSGVAVYVRGPSGLLAAARLYDDVSPPG